MERLLTKKRNLANDADERVDTRVLQLIVELPPDSTAFRIGEQVDAFLTERPAAVAVAAPVRVP